MNPNLVSEGSTISGIHPVKLDGEVLHREQSITKDICDTLKDYPGGITLFRELLQNADDAGAKVFQLVLDTSTSIKPANGTTESETKYLHPDFKFFAGASLYVFNDATFKESDFDAIRNKGKSNKVND